MDEKIEHTSDNNISHIKSIFAQYVDRNVNSFDDVRPWKVNVLHKFELTTEKHISQKTGRVLPEYNEVIRKEVNMMLEAEIITPVELPRTIPVDFQQKETVLQGSVLITDD